SAIVTLLVTTALVIGFAGLDISRYVFGSVPPAAENQLPNGLSHVVVSVDGLSCIACEILVRHALRRIDGVKAIYVSAATKTAAVEYEVAKTNPEQLVAAINSTGYRASLPNKMSDSASIAKNKDTNDAKDPAPASAGESLGSVAPNRVSLFKVPLQCLAAPQIGCGSAAKPILLDLERQSGVFEAWLNRAGTIIAVIWGPGSDAETRRNVAAELKEDHAIEMEEGAPRDASLKDFLSGKGWYRGSDVDRLSEEEAGIIAARYVRRVQAKTPLANDKAEGLERALADALRKKLTGDCSSPNQKQSSLEDVAREYLDQ